MKTIKYILFTAILLNLFQQPQLFAQQFADKDYYLIDSLDLEELTKADKQLLNDALKIYHQAKDDTSKIIALHSICENMMHESWEKYQFFQHNLIEIALFKKPLNPIKNRLLKSLASSLNNIGVIYFDQGNIKKALEYYHQSLKIQKELGDRDVEAQTLNNIGVIYNHQDNFNKALEYFKKSLKIRKEIKNQEGIAKCLNNIGNVYENQGDNLKALDYYRQSLKIEQKIGSRKGIANTLNDIGVIYQKLGENEKALKYYPRSVKIYEKLGDKNGLAIAIHNIGFIYLEQNNLVQAKEFAERSLMLAKELGSPDVISKSAVLLSRIYKKEKQGIKALEMFELHILMKDSINNKEYQKASAQQQAKYEYEKQKAIDDAHHDKMLAIAAEQEKKQKVLIVSIACGLILVLLFSVFIFNRLKITKKQKLIIEEKNQEIMDSITYAKRIQSAILPPNKQIKTHLTESFILYKPKDIVAGDFYWMESVSNNTSLRGTKQSPKRDEIASLHKSSVRNDENLVLFAAADCTGHGVPGAMVSVVCNNALNRSVREHGLTDPGEILNKTREIVIEEFEKSDEDVQDGMDIALCSLQGNTLQYAGAHNPLWIIRSNSVIANLDEGEVKQSVKKKEIASSDSLRSHHRNDEYTLIETKANKQPIGKYDNLKPYTTHTFELQKGDSIYIFSDGFVDQFGGEKGKKFKAKAFRKLLLSIQDKDMEEQRNLIDEAFEKWRGDLEQIDDVCVIGVKV